MLDEDSISPSLVVHFHRWRTQRLKATIRTGLTSALEKVANQKAQIASLHADLQQAKETADAHHKDADASKKELNRAAHELQRVIQSQRCLVDRLDEFQALLKAEKDARQALERKSQDHIQRLEESAHALARSRDALAESHLLQDRGSRALQDKNIQVRSAPPLAECQHRMSDTAQFVLSIHTNQSCLREVPTCHCLHFPIRP
jgi:chromosome segregation ATPase